MKNDLKNSTLNTKNGRYVLGGVTEVSLSTLEWWNKNEMPRDSSDITYVMEKKYEGRPDLLGYVFYADSALWWIICQYNNILNPLEELVEGKILFIPTMERVRKDLLSKSKPGGIKSTRQK